MPPLEPARLLRAVPRHAAASASLDERLLTLQRQGRIGFYGEARGQEAAVIGSAAALDGATTGSFPALREAGVGAAAAGCRCARYVAQIFGNANDLDARAARCPATRRRRAR